MYGMLVLRENNWLMQFKTTEKNEQISIKRLCMTIEFNN